MSKLSGMYDGFLGIWNLFCAMEYIKFTRHLWNSCRAWFPWGSQNPIVISKNIKQLVPKLFWVWHIMDTERLRGGEITGEML